MSFKISKELYIEGFLREAEWALNHNDFQLLKSMGEELINYEENQDEFDDEESA